MSIRLNLLREAQAADEARRRDPVKRAILAGVVAVSCVLGWSSVLQIRSMRVNSEFNGVQTSWKSIEKAYLEVADHRRLAMEAEERLVALQRLTTNRFLWGSTLNELQHLLAGTEGISLTRVRGEQTFLQVAETKPKGPNPAPAAGAKPAAPAPASVTERIVFTIDARDASSQPGDQVTKLKSALATPAIPGSTTTTRAKSTNLVSLLNISAPQSEQAGGPTYVTFTLQSTYPDRTRQ